MEDKLSQQPNNTPVKDMHAETPSLFLVNLQENEAQEPAKEVHFDIEVMTEEAPRNS